MAGDRIYIDTLNRRFRVRLPVELSEPPPNLRIARTSKPWRIYISMLGTVLPAFFLMYTSLYFILGIALSDPIMVLSGEICSIPLIFLIFRLHRPRLIHVRLATPDELGSEVHALPEGGSLITPTRTSFQRFLVRDDSILDMPPSRQLWILFAITVSVGVFLTALFIQSTTELAGIALFILLAIPMWLIGFSLPVLAWWGTSTNSIGLPTRRRSAESWLIAGMASAFPAFIFNSLIAPEITPSSFPQWAVELSLLAIWAPLCEEVFKAMAVAVFLPSIKGPKQGFQVGFTVGLGFALIENFQYIGFSLMGGPLSVTMTILVRGIGSIPGHAVWTAISGTAIGWIATDKEFKARMTWHAKSLAIGAIDTAEGLGIDTDGDGDLSGFDGVRQTLEEAIEEAMAEQSSQGGPWLISGREDDVAQKLGLPGNLEIFDRQGFPYEKSTEKSSSEGILLPKSLPAALALAISGHSIWNGSSFLSYHAPVEWLGIGEASSGLIMLGWMIFLIVTVLFVARSLMRGIRDVDSDF